MIIFLEFLSSNFFNHPVLRVAESCRWISKDSALALLSELKPCSDRLGPYTYIALLKSELPSNWNVPPALLSQVLRFCLLHFNIHS
jgi:hypothetical protein